MTRLVRRAYGPCRDLPGRSAEIHRLSAYCNDKRTARFRPPSVVVDHPAFYVLVRMGVHGDREQPVVADPILAGPSLLSFDHADEPDTQNAPDNGRIIEEYQ